MSQSTFENMYLEYTYTTSKKEEPPMVLSDYNLLQDDPKIRINPLPWEKSQL